jgi:hypothetical protein
MNPNVRLANCIAGNKKLCALEVLIQTPKYFLLRSLGISVIINFPQNSLFGANHSYVQATLDTQ